MRRYFIALIIFLLAIILTRDIALSGLAIILLCLYFIIAGLLHNVKNIHRFKRGYWIKKTISIIAVVTGFFCLNYINYKLNSFEKRSKDNQAVAIMDIMRTNIKKFYKIKNRFPYKREFLIIIYGGKIYDENKEKYIVLQNIGKEFVDEIWFSGNEKNYIKCGTAKKNELIFDKVEYSYNEKTGEIKFAYGYKNTEGNLWFEY